MKFLFHLNFLVQFLILLNFEMLDNKHTRRTSCADWSSSAAYYRDGELAFYRYVMSFFWD